MRKTHYTTSDLQGVVLTVIAILAVVAIVVTLALVPGWLLMVLMAQFGIVKPLWVWWLAIALFGVIFRARVEVNAK